MSPPSPLTPPPRMTPNLHAASCSPLCTSSFVLHREPPCAVVPWSQSGRTRNAGGGSNVASPSPDPATCQLYVATLAFMAHLLHLLLSAGLDPTAATRSLTKIPISSPQLAKHALEAPAFSIAVPPGGFKDDSYLDSPPTVAVDFLPKICLRDELGGWSMNISDLKKQLDGARSTYGRKRGKESRKCGENAFCQSFGLPLP